MSTDFQQARIALGVRLRELRAEAGFNGRELAEQLDWQASKVSRLEDEKQAPTVDDLTAWADTVGHPAAANESVGGGSGLWRRATALGVANSPARQRPRQEAGIAVTKRTRTVRGFESSVVPGIFQTADYAHHVITRYAAFSHTPPDTEAASRRPAPTAGRAQ